MSEEKMETGDVTDQQLSKPESSTNLSEVPWYVCHTSRNMSLKIPIT